jgi:hypothetical protein
MTRIHNDARGQATVLTLVFMTVLLGFAAFVLDAGAWFRSDRALQQTVDAAALAGVQALPYSTGDATGLATEYADKNGGGTPGITFMSDRMTNDTIKVQMSKPVPGFFSKVLGIDSVTVGAHAAARVGTMSQAQWAAPIGVNVKHSLLSGSSCPCFEEETTLELGKVGPGAFHLLNLDGSRGGTSPGTLADWMLRGFDGMMPLGWYSSDPGAKFNSSQVQSALTERIGEEMLFPVYDETRGQGANFEYNVIGWVGFRLSSFDARGNSGTLTGTFTRVIWKGIQSTSGSQSPNFGARSVQLVD